MSDHWFVPSRNLVALSPLGAGFTYAHDDTAGSSAVHGAAKGCLISATASNGGNSEIPMPAG